MNKVLPGFYIVSTPIGNLEDITLRAIEVIKNSRYIICENIQNSIKLLKKYDIHARLISYDDHSNDNDRSKIEHILSANYNEVISLISDAGTPTISDPGYKLVQMAYRIGCRVDVIPGACSVIAALTLSNMPTDKFIFYGFLPKKFQEKKKIFTEMIDNEFTSIFFESPKRLVESLKIALEIFGNNRECSVVRELTKIYQECKKEKLINIFNYYSQNLPRGEVILIIKGVEFKHNDEIILSELPMIKKDISYMLKVNIDIVQIRKFIFAKYTKIPNKMFYNLLDSLTNIRDKED